MRRIVKMITDNMLTHKIISVENQEIYEFGIYQGLFLIMNIFTTIFIGVISEMLWQAILFTISFAALRTYSGGYHARTYFACYIYSILLLLSALIIIKLTYRNIQLITFYFSLSVFTVLKFSPIEDVNKPLDNTEIKIYIRKSQMILFILFVIVVIAILLKLHDVSSVIAVATLSVSVLLIIGCAKNKCNF